MASWSEVRLSPHWSTDGLPRSDVILQPWHDFFILTGTAASTLLGLVFVAASIAATIPNEQLGDQRSRALWIVPILWAFVRVLVVSALGLIPWHTVTSFGCVLSALAVMDLTRMAWVTLGMRGFHRSRERLTLGDWGWHVIYPFLATLALAASGVSMAAGWPLPLHVLAAGLIGHLVAGVHNAWELADWLATRQ
jgi:hypothetical protein